MLAVNKW